MKQDKFYNENHRIAFLSFFILLLSSWIFIACTAKDNNHCVDTTETSVSKTTIVESEPTKDWVRFKTDAEKTF